VICYKLISDLEVTSNDANISNHGPTFERSQCAGRCRRACAHTNSALSKTQMTTNANLPSIVVSVWDVDLCAFIPGDLERQRSRWRAVGAQRRYRHYSNISMYVMLASTCASAALAPMADCCPLNADVARSCRFSCPERPMRPANELFSVRVGPTLLRLCNGSRSGDGGCGGRRLPGPPGSHHGRSRAALLPAAADGFLISAATTGAAAMPACRLRVPRAAR